MHELSIAQSVLEIVRQSVPERDLPDVSAVNMKVGEFSGVVRDSLEFSFSAITSGTPLHNSALVIEPIPFMVHCSECGQTSHVPSGSPLCPVCSGTDTDVVSGNELQVVSIELREEEP